MAHPSRRQWHKAPSGHWCAARQRASASSSGRAARSQRDARHAV